MGTEPERHEPADLDARLRTVLRAAQALPLYAGKLDGLDLKAVSSADLSGLPFTTRDDLRAAFAAAPDGGFDAARAALVHLTPSPGGWMPEYLSREDLRWQAGATVELFRRLGVGPGSRAVVAFSYHLFAGGWLFHDALLEAGATVLPHGPGEAARLAEVARAGGYNVLVANPTFARSVAAAGGRFRLLVAAGEPFSAVPGYRERVEAELGGLAVDAYGMSETGLLAVETLQRDGLHPLPAMGLLEIVDPATLEPTPDGEKGELVVTTLARDLMPLLRFRTGDLTVAGRKNGQLWLPRGVIGRTDEMVKVKGVKLYPRELTPLLAAVPGLDPRRFQVVVSRHPTGTDRLALRLAGEPGTDTEPLGPLLRRALGIGADEVNVVGELEGPLVVDERG